MKQCLNGATSAKGREWVKEVCAVRAQSIACLPCTRGRSLGPGKTDLIICVWGALESFRRLADGIATFSHPTWHLWLTLDCQGSPRQFIQAL